MSDCRNDCKRPLRFPITLYNRPGLLHIDYRIGAYADIREALLRNLDKEEVLQSWTHRDSDDPGIALLEGAAILADILTFYQDRYANEAYLRTSQWRESIADLVRLVGYSLSPGLGGTATFAFDIREDKPVTVPAGFPLQAQVDGLDDPADFETTSEITAYPALSKFNLYRPRIDSDTIDSGLSKLEIKSVDGATDPESISAFELNAGDRIMLIPDATMFDVTGTTSLDQKKAEILIVSEVEHVLDRTIITFEGKLTVGRGTQVTAHRLGRSFRHFGYNAPAQLTVYNNATPASVTVVPTDFSRIIWGNHPLPSPYSNFYSPLLETEIPLAEELKDLAVGSKLICQGIIFVHNLGAFFGFTVIKDIMSVQPNSLVWGSLSGPATMVTINSKLIGNESHYYKLRNIRTMSFHEVKGAELILRAPTTWSNSIFTANTLNFYGKYEDVTALSGRKLLLQREDGITQNVVVTSTPDDSLLSDRDESQNWMWPITVDSELEQFVQEDFDEQSPTVTVYGNLVDAAQGKTEKEAVLGNGDNRQVFQTFKLPKAPLTYLISAGESPPEVPELEIYVNDLLWTRVSSFFDRDSKEQIYIVREDANGDSWVQCGDGKNGSRLPSGQGNIIARYRTGTGAYGALKEDTTVLAQDKLDKLDKVYMPDVASGGSEAESGDNAREAAPGKIQSLDRLVSLKDFESEALGISGVTKAAASWELVDNVPLVVLSVLMESGREQEINDVRDIISSYNKCRGPQRWPIIVHQGKLKYVYVDLVYGLNPIYQSEIVDEAIKVALGATNVNGLSGLFGLGQRHFGQREYATRITGTVQNVEGVVWAKVIGFDSLLGDTDDPTELTFPAEPKLLRSYVPCTNLQVLSLFHDHLSLQSSAVQTPEVCT